MHNYFFQIAYKDGSVTNHEMLATVERVTAWASGRKSKRGYDAKRVTIDWQGTRQVVEL